MPRSPTSACTILMYIHTHLYTLFTMSPTLRRFLVVIVPSLPCLFCPSIPYFVHQQSKVSANVVGASSISIPDSDIDVCLDAGFVSQLVTAIVGVSEFTQIFSSSKPLLSVYLHTYVTHTHTHTERRTPFLALEMFACAPFFALVGPPRVRES